MEGGEGRLVGSGERQKCKDPVCVSVCHDMRVVVVSVDVRAIVKGEDREASVGRSFIHHFFCKILQF